jgi:hypothetical protein
MIDKTEQTPLCPECSGTVYEGCYPSCPDYRWTAGELEEMETLCTGQFDDLKLEFKRPVPHRVWLSRMTVDDGAEVDNLVTVTELRDGLWVEVASYPG